MQSKLTAHSFTLVLVASELLEGDSTLVVQRWKHCTVRPSVRNHKQNSNLEYHGRKDLPVPLVPLCPMTRCSAVRCEAHAARPVFQTSGNQHWGTNMFCWCNQVGSNMHVSGALTAHTVVPYNIACTCPLHVHTSSVCFRAQIRSTDMAARVHQFQQSFVDWACHLCESPTTSCTSSMSTCVCLRVSGLQTTK